MTLIGDIGIKKLIEQGDIIYHPINQDRISGDSIDFTLGNYFYRCSYNNTDIINPFDQECINKYLENYEKAITHEEWLNRNIGKKAFEKVNLDSLIIVLNPYERILAHTYEFIGTSAKNVGERGISGEIRATSSLARLGIQICSDSSHIDPGYSNRITLELFNMNKTPIALKVGQIVGKIVFNSTTPIEEYYGKKSNYQTSNNISEIIKNWKPEDMRPKAYSKTISLLPITDLRPEYQV